MGALSYPISGASSASPGYAADAMPFSVSVTASVSEIDVALGWYTGTNGATVSLWTDANGTPGTQLGPSWSVGNFPSSGTTDDTVVMISGISGINLAAGSSYLLVITPAASDTWAGWNLNTTGINGLTARLRFYSLRGAPGRPPPTSPWVLSTSLAASPPPHCRRPGPC